MTISRKSPKHLQASLYFVLMTAMLLASSTFAGPLATAQAPDTVNVPNVATAPTIDGALNETDWNLATSVAKTTIGSPNNTVTFGVLWNSTNLYVGVKVLDANLFNDSANTWEDDSVEIYIDANHNHGTVYDSFDRQFTKGYNDGGLAGTGSQTGVVHAWAAISGGYSVELAIPWSNLGVTPSAGMTIGFDVGYNDDDNGGTRDSQAVWFGTINNYNNTSAFGHALLQAGGGSTNTPTNTPVPTNTFTNTPVPTNTFTNTPIGPTNTPTNTPVPTNTFTNTPIGPTNTPTNTSIPPTNTPTNTPVSGQAPFGGTAWAIPGTIQAENYDTGGEGIAYHDLETANQGGQYRTTEGVDIEATTDTGGGYNVGWVRTDEWVEYTVNVATAGSYTLVARVASGVGTGSFHVEFDGVDKTGVVAVASTGGWQTWVNLSRTVSLNAGQQVMRIYMNSTEFNLNYLTFTGGATATPTNTLVGPTSTPTNTAGPNQPPNTPIINEPNIEGKIVNPADVHMETAPFSDPNPGQIHVCSDWEIWNSALTERVWFTSCIGGLEKVHTHLGDGVFQGSLAGHTELLPTTSYVLRVRHKDNSGQPATEWSAFAQRGFVTSAVSIGDPDNLWALRQPGYELQVAATGFQLPVNIAFVPNPGTQPNSPIYYVTELYGIVKVVTRDGTVRDYATGLLNFNPTGNFPGTGEQGVTGIVVEPTTKDVFVGFLYEVAGGAHYPKVMRFHSNDGGLTMATQTTILDMVGETQGQSHQISNLSFGPDGKLYVHMGDGFDATMGQNLNAFRGKILRVNLDGTAPTDNPLYNAGDGINARDYVYAYGFRNPFGGAWRAADNAHYEVENGPSRDRFAKVVANRNYLYDGTDASMNNFALYVWNPSRAPVNAAFVQTQTFSGSGFPANKMDHVYVSESGPTYASGPQTLGKRIVEFVLDASGNLVSGPTPLIEYTGVGKSTVVALAAGADGLYFSDLYKDQNFVSPIDRGANILRVQFVGVVDFSATPTSGTAPLNVQFTNLSTVPSPTSWSWDFGDGTTSTQQNPSHTYTATGSYNVRLTVTGASGSRSTLKSGFITVGP